MKKVLIVLAIFLVSCNTSSKKEKNNEEFVMYNPSELTLLMEEIYVGNEKLKQEIINGKITSSFSDDFLKIHSAVMTAQFERDDTFKILADNFIKSQQLIYSSTNAAIAKKNFNTSINLCVACHQNTCTGPIPRIKKLLIR